MFRCVLWTDQSGNSMKEYGSEKNQVGRLTYKQGDLATIQVRDTKAQDQGSDMWGKREGLDHRTETPEDRMRSKMKQQCGAGEDWTVDVIH